MNDQRDGKVSASRFEILALCPGSEQLRRALPPEAFNTGDIYSERGTKLHKASETGITFDLEIEDLEIHRQGESNLRGILQQWRLDFGITEFKEGPREERLWLHDDATLKPMTSAQLDRQYISINPPGFGLSVDLKSLWCYSLAPAAQNYQGRVQAVVLAKEHGLTHVRMAFNKAMLKSVDFCDYDKDALWRAEFSIGQAIWESEQPGAQFRPGDHCHHCVCKPYCVRAIKESESSVTIFNPPTDIYDITGKALKPRAQELVAAAPVEIVREIFGKRSLVNGVLEAVKDRLKALPLEEKFRLGLKMNKGRKTDFVKDVAGAFATLKESGYDDAQIFACLSFSKSDIVEMIQKSRGCEKAFAESLYEMTLDDFIERGTGEESLAEA